MFTTLAETYMTATRVETLLGQRNAESERIALMRARRESEKAEIAERVKEAQAARRKALVMRALRWTGHRLTATGQALSRFAAEAAPAKTPECS